MKNNRKEQDKVLQKKRKKRRKKNQSSRLVKVIYTLAALSALATVGTFFYPEISDAWNRYVSSKIISEYVENESRPEDFKKEISMAKEYNKKLFEESSNNISAYTLKLSGDTSKKDSASLSGEVLHPDKEYESQIDVLNNGMMGYIEIPQIGVSLPVYHYTSEEVLAKGIGHLYGSSLPVGGESTHAVLTGHCGLMDARLFTDLDKLKKGDRFTVNVFDEKLNYEIDQIKTVLPNELDDLAISKGEDYVTLMTCTPYGINSHRLLVRGHRISDDVEVKADQSVLNTVKETVRFPVTIFILAGLCVLADIIIIIRIWRK